MKSMPQEIEVWYLIPSLRRELAKIFIEDFQISQRKISQMLNITESAVSQYLKLKRGNELKFNREEIEEIKITAQEIIDSGSNANEKIYKLCVKLRACDSLCELHRKHDCTIEKDCDLCVV